jgi:hypothetical protein
VDDRGPNFYFVDPQRMEPSPGLCVRHTILEKAFVIAQPHLGMPAQLVRLAISVDGKEATLGTSNNAISSKINRVTRRHPVDPTGPEQQKPHGNGSFHGQIKRFRYQFRPTDLWLQKASPTARDGSLGDHVPLLKV